MPSTPEEKARVLIDQQLEACGWIVQDYRQMNISAGLGIAIREFPLATGEADYMLYADGRAIGVVEAKPEGHSLTGIEAQSLKYLQGLPANVPNYRLPLPFAYESTGTETRFANYLEPETRSRVVFAFHRPEELIRLVTQENQVLALLKELPPLNSEKLWRVQSEAITNLEQSLADNRPRALIQMATGSGKTFTAVNFCYRLIKHAKAKRILFLVDRNNLGEQTLNEFQQFVSPTSGYKFTDEYSVQHLKTNTIAPASKICITTIQRLYSMLKGEAEFDEANEEQSSHEHPPSDKAPPVHVEYNPNVPIETFDFIVVDECHRSIYGLWRELFEYFDASVIGLTATPGTQALAFFNQNIVQEYTHEKAVIDGVNVGFDVFTIETEITKKGATLKKAEPFVPVRDRRSRKKGRAKLDDDFQYQGTQLDRDVVNKSQIRLVIQTFKNVLPQIFPGRTEVPKTLVFAKTDLHADDVVDIIREEFGRGNDFCQKITSKSHNPKELLQQLRNAYNPRIAVTVDMIATGTDVKPLECLLFLRDVRSKNYFEQMKGRGCRIIDSDKLQSVTPDAKQKTHFVIIDAVGVCTSCKVAITTPLDRKPTVGLKKLLATVGKGVQDADTISALGAKLGRLHLEISPTDEARIKEHAGGAGLDELSRELIGAIDVDGIVEAASRRFEPTRQDAASTIGYFDPNQPIGELTGNLPHWRQEGASYFVTFRLADSLPKAKIELWKREQADWLNRHPEPLSPQQRREYFEKFVDRIHRWLDAGYGACLLQRPELRKIVIDAFAHFDRDRYELRGWVVMPNHVHAVVTPWGENDLSEILHSWKSFTAKEINKLMRATGPLWQKESFDHIVRSPESLERIEAYIAQNPNGLAEGTFSLSDEMQTRRDVATTDAASCRVDWEPTEAQFDQVERERCHTAVTPFHNPKLREVILEIEQRQRQFIDEQNFDKLLSAGFNAQAQEKAQAITTSFKQFIEDHKHEIEALQVLYSVPYRAGLKFRQVKELAAKLNQPPFYVDPDRPDSLTRLWQAFELAEPGKVRGKGGRQLVDVIALVRHAIDPTTPLAPVGMTVEERYQAWLSEKQTTGVAFTADQQKWLDAIKDHIASSLAIEQDDLEEVPFNSIGGLGRAYELFGEKLAAILEELNSRLAA